MEKLQANQILVKDANIRAVKLDATDATIIKMIEDTKKQQANVLKLKEVDQERLRMVVQF